MAIVIVNGRLPYSMLLTLDGKPLRADAARALHNLIEDVQRNFGWTLGFNKGLTGYRSVEDQITIFHLHYTTNYAASAKIDRKLYGGKYYWRRVGKPSAATPGTSNHGLGISADLGELYGFTSTRYSQLNSVAGRYGFNNKEGKKINEYWHWNFSGVFQEQEEEDMNAEQDARLLNIESAVGRLEAIYGAADARPRAGMLDDTHDKVLEIHAGVAGLTDDVAAIAENITGNLEPSDAKSVADEIYRRLAE